MLARLEGFVQEDGHTEFGRERGELLPPFRAVAQGGAQHRRALDPPAHQVAQYRPDGQGRRDRGGKHPLARRNENFLGRGQGEKRHFLLFRRASRSDGGVMLGGPYHNDGFVLARQFADGGGGGFRTPLGVEGEEKDAPAGDAPAVDSRHFK